MSEVSKNPPKKVTLCYRNSAADLAKIKYEIGADNGNFVGLWIKAGEPFVCFPYGFRAAKDFGEFKTSGVLSKELRQDIHLLLQTLTLTKTVDSVDAANLNQKSSGFPFQSYCYILQDYFLRGEYKERKSFYKMADAGKIDWGRTIKQIRPEFIDGVYLKFIVKKNSLEEVALLTQIHKYCILKAKENVGFLYGEFTLQKPLIPFNKNLFATVLKQKLSSTFNDGEKFLFYNMLCIVEESDFAGKKNSIKFGTNDFENVWERLIDNVFGIKNKDAFFPSCIWEDVLKSPWEVSGQNETSAAYETKPLRPDTVMLLENGTFVLDAKYYSYGITQNKSNLPPAESILKQIAYAEHIENNFEMLRGQIKCSDKSKIYNVFLLPYCASLHGKMQPGDGHRAMPVASLLAMKLVAKATASWKFNLNGFEGASKSYETIFAVLLDTKSLMENFAESKTAQKELAELCEKQLSE